MILYLDSSAVVKLYVDEPGSAQTSKLIEETDLVGTSRITRAEVSAALSKAVRMKMLAAEEGAEAIKLFRDRWADLMILEVSEGVVESADLLAWSHGLRGYDAVHLAAAQSWQTALKEPVTLATYDNELWQAAQSVGVTVWPTAP